MSGGAGNPVKILMDAVDLGLKDKKDSGFTQADVDRIYQAADELFHTNIDLSQDELNEVASQGFRVVVGSPTSGAEMALLLERAAQPPDVYTYRLLATTRTGTMQRELNEAASEGFRLLPSTMISKSRTFGPDEIVVILERAPNATKSYSYKLLATDLTGTLQREIAEAEADGEPALTANGAPRDHGARVCARCGTASAQNRVQPGEGRGEDQADAEGDPSAHARRVAALPGEGQGHSARGPVCVHARHGRATR